MIQCWSPSTVAWSCAASHHLKDLDSFLSIIGTESIGGIDLSTGGFSAEHGDRLAGVMSMYSLEPNSDKTHTELGLGLTAARAMSEGDFADGNGRLVRCRTSWLP